MITTWKSVEVLDGIAHRAVLIEPDGDAGSRLVCAVEMLPRIEAAVGLTSSDEQLQSVSVEGPPRSAIEARQSLDPADEPAADGDLLVDFLAEWLRFYTPVDPSWIAATLGISGERLDPSSPN